MGDTARATIGRDHRPQEYPIAIEDEVTPPPQAPPAPSSVRDYDSIQAPIREALESQHAAIEGMTSAIRRVWDARGDGARLERVETKVDLLMQSEARYGVSIDNLTTWAKSLTASVDSIERYVHAATARDKFFAEHQWPSVSAALDRLTKAIESIDARLATNERHVERLIGADNDRRGSISSISSALDVIDQRLDALEKRNTEADAGARATTALITQSKAKRNAIIGGIASVGAGAFAVIQWLVSKFWG
jgi:chromosome segregation ATPase